MFVEEKQLIFEKKDIDILKNDLSMYGLNRFPDKINLIENRIGTYCIIDDEICMHFSLINSKEDSKFSFLGYKVLVHELIHYNLYDLPHKEKKKEQLENISFFLNDIILDCSLLEESLAVSIEDKQTKRVIEEFNHELIYFEKNKLLNYYSNCDIKKISKKRIYDYINKYYPNKKNVTELFNLIDKVYSNEKDDLELGKKEILNLWKKVDNYKENFKKNKGFFKHLVLQLP